MLKVNISLLVYVFLIAIKSLNGSQRTGLFNNIDENITYSDFIYLIRKDQDLKKLMYADIEKQSKEDFKKLDHILLGYKGIIHMNLLKKYINQEQIKKVFSNEESALKYYLDTFKEINSKRIKSDLESLTEIFETEIKNINNSKIESDENSDYLMKEVVYFIDLLKRDDEIVLPLKIIDIFKKYLLIYRLQDNDLIKKYYLVLIKHQMMIALTQVIAANIKSEEIKNNFNKILDHFNCIDKNEEIFICFLECIIDQMELNNISSESIFLTCQIEEYIKALTNDFKIKEIKDLEYYFYIWRGKMIREECESLIKNKEKLPNIFIDKLKQQLILIRDKIAKLMESEEMKSETKEGFQQDITFYKIQRQKYLNFVAYNIMHERKIFIYNDNPKQSFEQIRNSIDMFFEDQTKKKDWLIVLLNIIINEMKLQNISSDMFLTNRLKEYIEECTINQKLHEKDDLLVDMKIVNLLKENFDDLRVKMINEKCLNERCPQKNLPHMFINNIKEYLLLYRDKYENALNDIKECYIKYKELNFNKEDRQYKLIINKKNKEYLILYREKYEYENENELNDIKEDIYIDYEDWFIEDDVEYKFIMDKKNKENDFFSTNYKILWNHYLIFINDIMINKLDLTIRNLVKNLFIEKAEDTFSKYFSFRNDRDFENDNQEIKFQIYVLKYIKFNKIVNIKNLFENREVYLYIKQFIDNTSKLNENNNFKEELKEEVRELRGFFNNMIINYERIKKNNQYKNIAIFLLGLLGVVVFFVLKTDTINKNISSIKIIKT